jgi:hypothetical protein
LEIGCSILSRDSTLDGKPSLGDGILGQAKGRERSSGGDLNLGGNNIDSGDLLCKTHTLIAVSRRIISLFSERIKLNAPVIVCST